MIFLKAKNTPPMKPPNLPEKPPGNPLKSKGFPCVIAIGAILATYFALIIGAILYNQSIVPEYRAEARLKILRTRISLANAMVAASTTGDKDRLLDDQDFNTHLACMRSVDIIRRVAKRLTQDERRETLAPYQNGNIFSGPLSPDEVIAKCRAIKPERQSFMAVVRYTHPNRDLAQKMANYFVQEIQRANEEEESSGVDPLIERLKIQNDQIQIEINDLNKKRIDLIEKKKLLSGAHETSTAQTELNDIEKEIKNKEDLFNTMTRTYETEKSKRSGFPPPSIRLVDSASVSDEPVNKNLRPLLVIAVSIATFISAGIVSITCLIHFLRRPKPNTDGPRP